MSIFLSIIIGLKNINPLSQVAREQCRDVPRQVEKQECFKVTAETAEWKSLISFLSLH